MFLSPSINHISSPHLLIAGDVDLSAIPRLAPTLGLQEGHTRRDLAVSRSSIKRRPASKRRSLLLHAGEREKMGTARVTLSEGERRPVRTSSTPAKVGQMLERGMGSQGRGGECLPLSWH